MLQKVTPETCVAFAIETEEKGAELYRELARKFAGDGELRELFEGLGRDEVHHGEQIRALGDRLVPRFRDRAITAEEQDFLRAMSMSDFFSGPGGLGTDVGGIRSREDALRRALHLEKATLGYYRALRDVVGPDEILDALIAMEKKHVLKVTARLVTEVMVHGLAESA